MEEGKKGKIGRRGRLEEGKIGRRDGEEGKGERRKEGRRKVGRRAGGRFILPSFQMQRRIKLCLKLTYRFRR